MKITMNEVDYVFDTCERGDWKVTFDYYNGWTPTTQIQSLMAELVGWDGETTIALHYSGMQNGLEEFLIVEQTVDSPIVWHRVSNYGNFSIESEMELVRKVIEVLEVLCADPLFSSREEEDAYIARPGYALVTKNRVKADQRMGKDLKGPRT